MTKLRVGYIGVGLMGHGAAKNILANGHPLIVLGNRSRDPVEDLVSRGAREAKKPAEVASESDVVFTCLPSSVEVEATLFGGGLLETMRPGMIYVDSTTADPNSTRRIGAELSGRGAAMVDGPLGRTPKEAEAGKLNTFLGGDPETIARAGLAQFLPHSSDCSLMRRHIGKVVCSDQASYRLYRGRAHGPRCREEYSNERPPTHDPRQS